MGTHHSSMQPSTVILNSPNLMQLIVLMHFSERFDSNTKLKSRLAPSILDHGNNVELLIKIGLNVNHLNSDGETALFRAIRLGNLKKFEEV